MNTQKTQCEKKTEISSKSKVVEEDILELFKALRQILDDKEASLLSEIKKITKNEITKTNTLKKSLEESKDALAKGKEACLKSLSLANLTTSSSNSDEKEEGKRIKDIPKYTQELLAKFDVLNVNLEKTAFDLIDIKGNRKRWEGSVKVMFIFMSLFLSSLRRVFFSIVFFVLFFDGIGDN